MSHLLKPLVPHILLADDDDDDCLLFKEALKDLPFPTRLTTNCNGDELMEFLHKNEPIPDVLFLDLNMPRKGGLECLSEIRQDGKLEQLPVIIFSTSFQPDIVEGLYKNGASYYVCKPNEYPQLVKVIYDAITTTLLLHKEEAVGLSKTSREDFVLSPKFSLHER